MRKIFGERVGDHSFIVTIPGRGYCFVAPVTAVACDSKHDELPLRLLDPGTLTGAGLAFLFMFVVAFGFVWSYAVNATRSQSLAIMQFRAATAGDEFIGAGISDTLRARLGSVQDLTVRPSGGGVAGLDAIAAGREMPSIRF